MSSKKGVISNLKDGIGVPQRIGLIVVGIVVIGSGIYMFNNIGAREDKVDLIGSGASLEVAPKENEISKTKPGQELNVPKDSKLAKQLEAGRQQKIEEIKQDDDGSSSYISQLRVQNTAQKEAEAKAIAEAPPKERVRTGLTKIMEERARERQMEDAQENKQRVQQAPVDQGPVLTRSMILDAYLQEELAAQVIEETIFQERMGTVSEVMNQQKTPVYVSVSKEEQGKDGKTNNGKSIRSSFASNSNGVSEKSGALSEDSIDLDPSDGQVFEVLPGEEFFALLDDQVNTDEAQSIMARVLDGGRFHGANLIGGVDNHGEKVSLIFNAMTFEGKVYRINAVAFDLKTDSTSMTDYTDNHIIERYGSLALAAFLDGYAQALSGSTSTTTPEGNTTTTTQSLPDASDQIKVAVGNIGTTFVPVLQEKFNRPPTVHVNSGRALGIRILEPFNI